MREVSKRFLAAVRSSHRMTARARLVTPPGQTGADPDGVPIPVLGGDVIGDMSKAIRHTLALDTDGVDWSADPTDPRNPYGAEVFVERGVVFAGGAVEWVSLGYYRLYDVDQDAVPHDPLRISARDRMSAIVDARLEQPVQYPAGSTVGQVFADLVGEVYPGAVVLFDDDTDGATFTRAQVVERDRYKFLRDAARSRGKVFYFDHLGRPRVESPPDPGAPVFDIDHGPGGVLVNAARSVSREGVYNAVVATGEGTDDEPPAFGVARDMNPTSPTYYLGSFGRVPRFYSSPMLDTDAQAVGAARVLLEQSLALPYEVNFAAVPNPALEVGDPLRVRYPGRSEVHVAGRLVTPLTAAAPLTGATRRPPTDEGT